MTRAITKEGMKHSPRTLLLATGAALILLVSAASARAAPAPVDDAVRKYVAAAEQREKAEHAARAMAAKKTVAVAPKPPEVQKPMPAVPAVKAAPKVTQTPPAVNDYVAGAIKCEQNAHTARVMAAAAARKAAEAKVVASVRLTPEGEKAPAVAMKPPEVQKPMPAPPMVTAPPTPSAEVKAYVTGAVQRENQEHTARAMAAKKVVAVAPKPPEVQKPVPAPLPPTLAVTAPPKVAQTSPEANAYVTGAIQRENQEHTARAMAAKKVVAVAPKPPEVQKPPAVQKPAPVAVQTESKELVQRVAERQRIEAAEHDRRESVRKAASATRDAAEFNFGL